MKKLLTIGFAAMLIFAMASVSSAQLGPIGIKAGMNMADLGGDVDNSSMKAGLVVGAWANFSLGMFDIQPELLYSMKGSKIDNGDDQKYNYFEVPILVKYNLPLPGALKPSLYAGPSFSILMSAKNGDVDIKDNLKSSDYSIIVGAGVMMDMQAYVLTFDARYNLGLSDINDLPNSTTEVKNSAIMLMAGIGFNLPGM